VNSMADRNPELVVITDDVIGSSELIHRLEADTILGANDLGP